MTILPDNKLWHWTAFAILALFLCSASDFLSLGFNFVLFCLRWSSLIVVVVSWVDFLSFVLIFLMVVCFFKAVIVDCSDALIVVLASCWVFSLWFLIGRETKSHQSLEICVMLLGRIFNQYYLHNLHFFTIWFGKETKSLLECRAQDTCYMPISNAGCKNEKRAWCAFTMFKKVNLQTLIGKVASQESNFF